MQKNIFITGGNRDIGLALVKNYIADGHIVYTTYRNIKKSYELLEIKNANLKILKVDFLDLDAIDKISIFLQKIPIDIVINNASFFPYNVMNIDQINVNEWQKAFYINTIFPTLLSETLKQNLILSQDKKLVFISSRRGSNSINARDKYKGRYGYRSTKLALNSCALAISKDFFNKNITVLILHPGRIATEITSFSGSPPKVAAQNIIKQIKSLSLKETGQFISAETGDVLQW